MTAAATFAQRVDALALELSMARESINGQGVDPKLYARAGDDLQRRLDDQATKIDALRTRVGKAGVTTATWGALHGYEQECANVFGECLAFVHAGRARAQDSIADVCEMAEAMLDELSAQLANITWGRFTVHANGEFFSDMVQIIRLRFPSCGIWDLPVAAHEFGHFVAGRLNLGGPDGSHYLAVEDFKKDFLQQRPSLGAEWSAYLDEFFADVFATFALGPAYACTCLLLRFDPLTAPSALDESHPPAIARARVILRTLHRLNAEKDNKGDLAKVIEFVGKRWEDALVSAGHEAAGGDDPLLDGVASNFYQMLKSGAPAVRFSRWRAAAAAAGALPGPAHKPDAGALEPALRGRAVADILNIAWFVRFKPGTNSAALSKAVLDAWRQSAAPKAV